MMLSFFCIVPAHNTLPFRDWRRFPFLIRMTNEYWFSWRNWIIDGAAKPRSNTRVGVQPILLMKFLIAAMTNRFWLPGVSIGCSKTSKYKGSALPFPDERANIKTWNPWKSEKSTATFSVEFTDTICLSTPTKLSLIKGLLLNRHIFDLAVAQPTVLLLAQVRKETSRDIHICCSPNTYNPCAFWGIYRTVPYKNPHFLCKMFMRQGVFVKRLVVGNGGRGAKRLVFIISSLFSPAGTSGGAEKKKRIDSSSCNTTGTF